MTNPTSNFGWQMPTPTDLVTDLPADFEVFGQAVDTSLADLKGGTTGQILSKASASDMDFTWTTANPGDITAVNVTAPITGGGTSGDVTIGVSAASTSASGVVQLTNSTSSTSITTAAVPANVKTAFDLATTANTAAGTAQTTANAAIPKSTVTTAGDVIYATGSSAVTRLGIGSAGNVLTVSGGVPVWAAPAGGGKVLQVVQGSTSTGLSSSSATMVNTGLTATITPSSVSSKILVLVSQGGIKKTVTNTQPQMGLKLVRGATDLLQHDNMLYTNTAVIQFYTTHNFNFLDSPATTAATTYKTMFNNPGGVAEVAVQNGGASYIILMEIGA
jgi:hypothetical protein